METTRDKLLAAEKQLNAAFVGREHAIRVIMLAHLCREHYLLVGTPGTAKTAVARAFAKHIVGARFFATLLGAFTSPEKVFGPLDIAAFQAGEYKVVRGARLAAAEFAFLDEYFKSNEGVLNELLTALNEREFEGGPIPLMTCGAATNWPEIESRSENVAALYDRTLLRCVVEDLTTEDDVVELLARVDGVAAYAPSVTVTLDELKCAIAEVQQVRVSEAIRKLLHNVRSRLLTRDVSGKSVTGIEISSRRIGQLQKVLRASAWLAGRTEVTVADFSVLGYGLWNDRRDIEVVAAVLDTLDAELVRMVVDAVDQVRREYEQVKRAGFGSASVNALAGRIEQVARNTRAALDEPVFTAAGRQTIGRAIAPLKAAMIELTQRIEAAPEKGAAK